MNVIYLFVCAIFFSSLLFSSLFSLRCAILYLAIFAHTILFAFLREQPFVVEQFLICSHGWSSHTDSNRTESIQPSQSNFRWFSLNFLWHGNAIFRARPSGESFEKAKCTKLNYIWTCKSKWMPKKKWTATKMQFLPSNTKSGQFSWTWISLLLTFRPSALDFCSCCFSSFEFTFCVVVFVVVVRNTPSRINVQEHPNHIGQVNLDQLFLRDETRARTWAWL